MSIRLSSGKEIPIEMHKVRILQKIRLASVGERLKAIEEGGYNTFLLRTRDVFLHAHGQRCERHERLSAGRHDGRG